MSVWRDWSSVVCSSDVVCAVLVLPLKFGVLAFGRYSAKIVYVLFAVVPVGMVYVTLAAPLATVVLVAAVPIVVVPSLIVNRTVPSFTAAPVAELTVAFSVTFGSPYVALAVEASVVVLAAVTAKVTVEPDTMNV